MSRVYLYKGEDTIRYSVTKDTSSLGGRNLSGPVPPLHTTHTQNNFTFMDPGWDYDTLVGSLDVKSQSTKDLELLVT